MTDDGNGSSLGRLSSAVTGLGNVALTVLGAAIMAWPITWLLGITSSGGKAGVFAAVLGLAALAGAIEWLDRRFGLLPRIVSRYKKRDVRALMTRGFGRKPG